MDRMVDQYGLRAAYPYLDNVTICSHDQQDHDVNLQRFLQAAQSLNLTYNKEKCVSRTTRLAILDYVVENGVLGLGPDRMCPLTEHPPSHSLKALKRCLGLFYYAQWVPNYADKARPLIQTTSFPLTAEARSAFSRIKADITKAAMHAVDESVPFQVESAASDVALAATLNQAGKPVAFFSRTLHASEIRHSSVEKEAQSIVEAVRHWRHYLAVAPIKALCNQRHEDWKEKFGPIGLNCKELTGDTEMDDYFEIQDAHIIITTPVHVVKDECRGATLEVVVSRMKTVQLAVSRVSKQTDDKMLRFVAVSATIPNVKDIAEWLSDGKGPGISMKIDESYRPVKLRKVVIGFPCSSTQTEFKFDLSLNYRTASVIQTYSEQKPALVFCATRKGVQQAASILAKDAKFVMTMEHKQRLQKYTNSVKDTKLRDLLIYGVGYHHAGMDLSDRKAIEAAFTAGDVPVLYSPNIQGSNPNVPHDLHVFLPNILERDSETQRLQQRSLL
ncbi:hypothetical protein scyTo_0001292 [Scyliorhinus torazame]|uniref:Helicase ATP-binding domain-containing protein n=1 Tax=Scyliorhinus torazame TaxID=75743 RepID=A0A401PBH0_SCYTO|nr:hypothetical protein [Scyliorhinus torazame]